LMAERSWTLLFAKNCFNNSKAPSGNPLASRIRKCPVFAMALPRDSRYLDYSCIVA